MRTATGTRIGCPYSRRTDEHENESEACSSLHFSDHLFLFSVIREVPGRRANPMHHGFVEAVQCDDRRVRGNDSFTSAPEKNRVLANTRLRHGIFNLKIPEVHFYLFSKCSFSSYPCARYPVTAPADSDSRSAKSEQFIQRKRFFANFHTL